MGGRMMRFTITVLLLVVCFLAGVIMGMNNNQVAYESGARAQVNGEDVIEAEEKQEETKQVIVYPEEHHRMDQTQPVNVMEKIAFFLESCVKGFYEIIVNILSAISEQFL